MRSLIDIEQSMAMSIAPLLRRVILRSYIFGEEFYILLKIFVASGDYISVAFELILVSCPSLQCSNARIAPSKEMGNILEIIFNRFGLIYGFSLKTI